jgi:hypothetical protein
MSQSSSDSIRKERENWDAKASKVMEKWEAQLDVILKVTMSCLAFEVLFVTMTIKELGWEIHFPSLVSLAMCLQFIVIIYILIVKDKRLMNFSMDVAVEGGILIVKHELENKPIKPAKLKELKSILNSCQAQNAKLSKSRFEYATILRLPLVALVISMILFSLSFIDFAWASFFSYAVIAERTPKIIEWIIKLSP